MFLCSLYAAFMNTDFQEHMMCQSILIDIILLIIYLILYISSYVGQT
jgi:hypothetical protein